MKINSSLHILTCLGTLALGSCLNAAGAQTQLANPGFEEDVANVGNPDGWEIGKDAVVKVVSGNAAAGNRALLVEGGYATVQQNLQLPQLAGQQVTFSIAAKAVTSDAVFGARLGYYATDGKWRDVALLWNRKLTEKYQTFTASRKLPANAKPGRLWLAIYRSDRKSAFYIDNVKLEIGGLDAKTARRAVALARDARYFLNRIEAATKENIALRDKAEWQQEAERIEQEANATDSSLADKFNSYETELRSLNTALFTAIAANKALLTSWAPAFERLAPDALPPLRDTLRPELTALRGEHCAFGLDVAGGGTTPRKITLRLSGLPANCSVIWRRQVFTETWYTKGKALLADPLTRLSTENGNTILQLLPGEVMRLYADIGVAGTTVAGNYPLQIVLTENGAPLDTRRLNLRILSQVAPAGCLAHYEFGYTNAPVIANHTADAVRDLVEHGVTDIEWAFMPPSVFDEQGNLQKVDFSTYNRLLKDFGTAPIRLNVFWQPSYDKFKTPAGGTLEILSPPWRNALGQLFAAWLKNAQEQGVPTDHITVLAADEIHSKALEKSPDESIERFVQISQLLHSKFPGLKNYLTLSYYAFPPDVEKALPQVDVVLPHLPQPEKLTRNAPPTYNPRQAFEKQIYPMLHEARQKRGLQIGSYHVAAGRSDDLLQWNRFYPLLAAATGHTGIGFWAYNANTGSNWDDTDGNLLDYNFVYDGTEKNPVCRRFNVTGETVVPSVRWEAVRAGSQDAEIFLALQEADESGKLNTEQRAAFAKLTEQAKRWNGNREDAAAQSIMVAGVEAMSRQLREIYSSVY